MSIVMCYPKYFDVIHKNLNKHMSMKKPINKELALSQYDNIVENIRKLGITINFIPPIKDLPDMVFSANAGIMIGDKVIISNFKAKPRQNESSYYKTYFGKNKKQVFTTDKYFEGEGDCVLSHNKKIMWLGCGERTESKCKYCLKQIYKLRVITLELVDPYFYHLDTCFRPLPSNHIVLYPEAFSKKSLVIINQIFPKEKRIPITKKEALDFFCNALIIKKRIYHYLCNKSSTRLRSILSKLNYKIIECPCSEFLLAGGSIKCMCLIQHKVINLK